MEDIKNELASSPFHSTTPSNIFHPVNAYTLHTGDQTSCLIHESNASPGPQPEDQSDLVPLDGQLTLPADSSINPQELIKDATQSVADATRLPIPPTVVTDMAKRTSKTTTTQPLEGVDRVLQDDQVSDTGPTGEYVQSPTIVVSVPTGSRQATTDFDEEQQANGFNQGSQYSFDGLAEDAETEAEDEDPKEEATIHDAGLPEPPFSTDQAKSGDDTITEPSSKSSTHSTKKASKKRASSPAPSIPAKKKARITQPDSSPPVVEKKSRGRPAKSAPKSKLVQAADSTRTRSTRNNGNQTNSAVDSGTSKGKTGRAAKSKSAAEPDTPKRKPGRPPRVRTPPPSEGSTEHKALLAKQPFKKPPRVVFASSSGLLNYSHLRKFLIERGCKVIADPFRDNFDLLIVGNTQVQRTAKVMLAIASGKPIVTARWAIKCSEEQELLGWADFVPEKVADGLCGFDFGQTESRVMSLDEITLAYTPALKKSYGATTWKEIDAIGKVLGAEVEIMSLRQAKEMTDVSNVRFLGLEKGDLDALGLVEEGLTVYKGEVLFASVIRGSFVDDGDDLIIKVAKAETAGKGRRSRSS